MKKGPFKMKGFSGFGNSPAKQTLDKPRELKQNKKTNFNVSNPPVKPSTNGGTVRAISGFEADFPKVKKTVDLVKHAANPKTHLDYLKTNVKRASKAVRQGLNYFKAR